MSQTSQLTDGVWTISQDLRLGGVPLGARMTIIRLNDGGLWVHSPVELTEAVKRELDERGPVRVIVAPNLMHHLFVSPYMEAYPSARLYVAPGLKRKRVALRDAEDLPQQGTREWLKDWGVEIESCFIEGMPMLNETVFFHRPSKTLIVSDLVFNLPKEKRLLPRLIMKLNQTGGRLAPSLFFRLNIKDEESFKDSLQTVREWEAERLVMAHGQVIEEGAAQALRSALRRYED